MNASTPTLLIVEDDPGLRRQLRWSFERYDVQFAEDREKALAQVRRHRPAVVLQDLGLPPDAEGVEEGMRSVSDILAIAPDTKIIVVTGNGDEQSAVRAVGMGAWDFYQKPVDTDVLDLIVSRAFHIWKLEQQNRQLLEAQRSPLQGLIAGSDAMLRVCAQVERVADTAASVLLLGDTGTGKELLAKALHQLSLRRDKRFVAINCAAIPENLLESELFGYEKGAFTGAAKQTPGKIETADGGTLFLDEIGDMPAALQAKLLRFLQERKVERVGGRHEIAVDVRVVCATHHDLQALINEGGFRQDLFYRIAEVVVNIPPLRAREGDAVLLARTFVERSAARHGRAVRGLAPDAIEAVQGYDWPGNVRELENKVNSAVIMAEGRMLTARDLGLAGTESANPALTLREARHEGERRALDRALGTAAGNLSHAAELLGISRPTLYDLLRKHNISAS
ncbi:MAG TPA: PEP-CTERM-box response regulator transcription factor [Gammaproteobacteria bacterium]|nr:PEP-CTERM-box response regulator transcription factor [Gammaproteobacteria bacterium]